MTKYALGVAMIGVCCCGLIGGCEDKPAGSGSERSPAAGTADRGEPTGVYEVRGEISSLPDAAKPGSELRIRHEAIPDFKDASGAIIGMNAMVMPFPLAPGVSLEGFKVGDKVKFTFAAWMQPGKRGWEIRTITHLPAGTELQFGKAKKAGESPESSGDGESGESAGAPGSKTP
ncbi:MAG TPA: copper-binding protein [Phycisphaerales bacterium]|nr:copper-binding protein [Phycisphaerales bacterium]